MLSLVIPSLNTKGHLENLLLSLETHPPTQPYEVIVVEMSSTDGTPGDAQVTLSRGQGAGRPAQ